MQKTIAFDFFGVLVKHDGKAFVTEEQYLNAEPNPEVVNAMKILRGQT